MPPSTAPDHSSPHSPSPSANNNLPVRSSAKNTSFLHSGNPSTPKHSVESYPCPKTSIIRTMCSRNFSVLINQSQKTPKIFFFILSPNFALVNKLTPIRPPGESSPFSRPPTAGSGSGVVAPAAQTGALASAESESCARGRRWVGDDGRPSGPGVKRL